MRIAIDIPPTYPPVWEIAAGALKYAAERHDLQIVFPSRRIARAINANRIEWNGSDSWDGAVVPFYRPDLTVPQVITSPHAPEGEIIVTMDDAAIAKLAVDQFTSMGLEHFGFLGVPGWELPVYRWTPFSEQLQEQGFEATYIPRNREMGEVLENLPKPCGVMAFNDSLGIELLNLCSEMGLRVPGDVYVISVDDTPECIELTPTLSSIALPTSSAGYAATRLCARLIAGASVESIKIQPSGLILRESVKVKKKDIHTAAAMAHYLRTHLAEPIQMEDLVLKSDLSRRRLEQLFRSTYDSSPIAYLKELRLKKAQELLQSTDGPLNNIIEVCGYSDTNHLCRVFRQRVGTSPRRYRERHRQGDS